VRDEPEFGGSTRGTTGLLAGGLRIHRIQGQVGVFRLWRAIPSFAARRELRAFLKRHGLDCHQKRRGAARETSSPCDFIPVCYRQPRAGSPRNCFV